MQIISTVPVASGTPHEILHLTGQNKVSTFTIMRGINCLDLWVQILSAEAKGILWFLLASVSEQNRIISSPIGTNSHTSWMTQVGPGLSEHGLSELPVNLEKKIRENISPVWNFMLNPKFASFQDFYLEILFKFSGRQGNSPPPFL